MYFKWEKSTTQQFTSNYWGRLLMPNKHWKEMNLLFWGQQFNLTIHLGKDRKPLFFSPCLSRTRKQFITVNFSRINALNGEYGFAICRFQLSLVRTLVNSEEKVYDLRFAKKVENSFYVKVFFCFNVAINITCDTHSFLIVLRKKNNFMNILFFFDRWQLWPRNAGV